MTTNIKQEEPKLGTFWLFKEKFGFNQIPLDIAYEAYYKSLLICANGDGTLADEERDWVIGYAYAYNCDPAIIEKLKVYKADEEIETVITQHNSVSESRPSLIFDAIQACCADGEYSDKERSVVLRGAKKLNISEDEFNKIEELYLETVKLREKRLAVFYPNGSPL
ncbi:hypothetical protein Cylst_5048 [Cylindrospermum stagnale PCC 7417]|uniref:Co-chaperone DjlA N-terminal domain-containing protein n=1 Tax=Cylindrospermum stagnale PCC 7417 TaxID=56107 RepID=K9X395_9NOST|nr:hypothetical protein [Cylindrospermum stagnale]AFZ27095.1 hypothetical protein Cylst_5048 [Cylindrospermum stagnale PCC 7417]